MKTFFKWCGYLVVFSILMGLVLSFIVETKDDLSKFSANVSGWNNSLRFVRWALIASLVVFWSEICQFMAKYKELSSAQLEHAKTMKWRVIGALIVFEILIIESLPTKLIEG
ncbi:MAG: hypothetical protein HUJ23_01985 [Methylophaga sp.]|nr:hypothetical protein [Methylophaga sp.]